MSDIRRAAITWQLQDSPLRWSVGEDGQKVYTTDVVLDDIEFAESKSGSSENDQRYSPRPEPSSIGDGFMNIPDGLEEELPFC